MKKLFIGTTMLAAVIAIGFAVSAYAWQPPTVSAPGGNVDAPLNTGPAMQIKSGALGSLDTGWGIFGLFSKFQHGFFGPGCPLICPASNTAGTDLFTAGIPSGGTPPFAPLFKGVSVLDDGTFRLKGNTAAVPGQVLTAVNADGDVDWQNVQGALPQGNLYDTLNYGPNGWRSGLNLQIGDNWVGIPGGVTFAYMQGQPNIHIGDVLTAVNTSGSIQWKPAPKELPPSSTDSYTLRYDGIANAWKDSGLIQNSTEVASVNRPANSTNSDNFQINLNANPSASAGGRNILTAKVSDGNVTAGESAVLKTNAKGFALWDLSGANKVDLAAKGGFFSQMVDSPRGQFTSNVVSPRAYFGSCNNGFSPLLSCFSLDQTNVFTASASSTVSPNANLFGATTTPRGIIVDNAGSFIVHDWTTLTPPAGLAGKVLTADAAGKATWQAASLSPGILNHTLRNNGTAWVDTGLLQNTGAQVAVVPTSTSTLVPFVIDMSSVPGTGAAARNGINIKVNQQVLNANEYATVQTNAKGFTLWSTLNNSFADLRAHHADLSGSLTGQNATLVGTVKANKGHFDYTNTGRLRVGCANLAICDTNTTDYIRAGTYLGNIFKKGLMVKADGSITAQNTGITVDISDASNTGSAGTDALILNANPNAKPQYPDQVDIVTNTGQLHFWSTKPDRNNFTDIRAGETTVGNYIDQLALNVRGLARIAGGNPSQGKVLASNNDQGDAEWGTLQSDVTKTYGTPTVTQVTSKCDQAALNAPYSSSVHCELTDKYTPPLSIDGNFQGVRLLVRCPANTVLVGGGGSCQRARKYDIPSTTNTGNGPVSGPKIDEPNTWQLICGMGASAGYGAEATAYCLSTTQFLTDVSVTTTVATTGGKQWHLAGDLKTGQAPNPYASTCNAAYASAQYGNHTFLNNPPQVGYIHQKWEGFFYPVGVPIPPGTPNVVLISGPGDSSPAGYSNGPGPINDSDIIKNSGCVTRSDNALNGNYGQNYTTLPTGNASGPTYWQDKVVDAPDLGGGSNYYGTQDIWYTYLYY